MWLARRAVACLKSGRRDWVRIFLRELFLQGCDMANQQSTLLTGEEIKSEKLVTDGADKFYRASTYDLSVGDIIPAGGELWTESKYSVPPGGMVRVISKESLKLSDEVTGHVLLKNDLCTKGFLQSISASLTRRSKVLFRVHS